MGNLWPMWPRHLCSCIAAVFLLLCTRTSAADIIFDVFVGYGLGVSDGCVAEASWFPVTCEVQNNGPGFNGTVEISAGHGGRRVVRLELPSGTKKRLTIPLYCGQKSRIAVDATLRNEKGKLIAEHRSLEPRMQVDSQSRLAALFPRKHGALIFPEAPRRMPQYAPGLTHLNAETFPENPIALEGVDFLYLHSTRAVDLKAPQVNALLAWLHGGGRLVLGVEQPGDVKALEWLQGVIPCDLGNVSTNTSHSALQQWLTRPLETLEEGGNRRLTTNVYARLAVDAAFEAAPLPVTAANMRDGAEIVVGTLSEPLIVSARRGRGELIVLLFSPELAPFNEWVNRNWFWARMAGVPAWWLAGVNAPAYSNTGLDGVFGAMVDSRQIRKLPIGWLLLLLIVYLVVIGPLDQYWLKKINKQMLTWITFPTYVVIFSGLIYFIGYTLRSGETEWNELQVVDVIPHGPRADLRGRTYGSAYSPLNATYTMGSDQPFATFRGEVATAGEQSENEDTVEVQGNSFAARVVVPVWTSQLYVQDWWRQDAPPLDFTVSSRGNYWDVQITTAAHEGIYEARLVIGDQVYHVNEPSGFKSGKRISVARHSGQPLHTLVQAQQGQFSYAVSRRQSQFGSQDGGHLDKLLESATAASFISVLGPDSNSNQDQPYGYQQRFTPPRGFDLLEDVRRGSAVLIALVPDRTIAAPMNKFTPRFSKKNSVLRVIKPVE